MHGRDGSQVRRARDQHRPRGALGFAVAAGRQPSGLFVRQGFRTGRREVAGFRGSVAQHGAGPVRLAGGTERVPPKDGNHDERVLPVRRSREQTAARGDARKRIAQLDRFRRDGAHPAAVRAEFR